MQLGQITWNDNTVAAIFQGELARPIPDYTLYDLVRRSDSEGLPLAQLASRLASAHREPALPLIPVKPREVWACGCTYEQSATFRDGEHGTREGFYAHVHRSDRPEIFFKGTGRVCVGPGQSIGIRADSKFTAPEPELAVLLGAKGRVVGFTLGNDVSAWDIERENPLFLPQSKVYNACCALGPVVVTADELTDIRNLEMSCAVRRGGETIFSGSVSLSRLSRTVEHLVGYLMRSNSVPGGSILLTGTGIIVPESAALKPGDVVTITVPGIGTLENTAAQV
jgi:2-dehydro-3-deoxy-D-arabinonate dehydratase